MDERLTKIRAKIAAPTAVQAPAAPAVSAPPAPTKAKQQSKGKLCLPGAWF
jgi:hypothetical protein